MLVEPPKSHLSLEELYDLFNFRKSPVRFEIFRFSSQKELLDKIQFLNRDMYYNRVPQILYRVLFIISKFPPEFEFVDLLRNTNFKTHQFKMLSSHKMMDLTGQLTGEFIINTDLPDGRCRFITDDRNTQILCYFKNGVLQKGPRLHYDIKAESVVIRGYMNTFQGSNLHMET